MKNRLLMLIAIALLALPLASALAQETQSDGSIQAVMRVDPNGVAREPAGISFEFTDSSGALDLFKCNCAVAISLGSTTLATKALNTDGGVTMTSSLASFRFTFPEEGAYEIVATGTPVAGATFKPFKLSYELSVGKESAKASPAGEPAYMKLLKAALLAAALCIVLGYVYRFAMRKRKAGGD